MTWFHAFHRVGSAIYLAVSCLFVDVARISLTEVMLEAEHIFSEVECHARYFRGATKWIINIVAYLRGCVDVSC